MAEYCDVWQVLVIVLLFCGITWTKEKAAPIQLTEETWQDMLKGEWLVKL